MKTKEMLIIEVSKEFKEELDKLDTVSETRGWFNTLEVGEDVFTELFEAQKELQFEYVTQVLMYLVSTRNYVEKPEPIFYVVYGTNFKEYFITESNLWDKKVEIFVSVHLRKAEALKQADRLNNFTKGE